MQTAPDPALTILPTETGSAASSPEATPTPSPSVTPTPENPMSIRAMQAAWRAGTYAGSPIVIEQELDPGSNYHRYYASYRSEGLKIYALLTVPNGDPPPGGWPGIVFNHGFIPPEIYRTTERYVAYVDRLASAGFVVFRIDYRGNDRSEGIPKGAYGDPGYTIDVLNAVATLKQFPQVNPQKIGMWGHSMGGFLTLRTMVVSPDIKAGVIWAGVVGSYADLLERWHRLENLPTPTPPPGSTHWRNDWAAQYGTPEQNPAFWDSISAPSFLANLSGPLQLHHGTADKEVPLVFSQNLAQQIQAAGGSAELFTYPGNDHNLSQSFTLAMDRTVAFFTQYLK